jgi:hypothetical protein
MVASRSSETVAAVVAEVEAFGGDAIGVTCDESRERDLTPMSTQ